MEFAVQIEGLPRACNEHDILTGIDVTVEVGRRGALLGPNGAGTTTTIEILEGFRQRDGGAVQELPTNPDAMTPRSVGSSDLGVIVAR